MGSKLGGTLLLLLQFVQDVVSILSACTEQGPGVSDDQKPALQSYAFGGGFLSLSTFLTLTIKFYIIHLLDVTVHINLWVESWVINESFWFCTKCDRCFTSSHIANQGSLPLIFSFFKSLVVYQCHM